LKLRIAPQPNGTKFQRAFDALGWRQSARLQTEPLNMEDRIDVAYTLDHNDHPDFGGLQLILSDWTKSMAAVNAATSAGTR
jgi:hypothetical protein